MRHSPSMVPSGGSGTNRAATLASNTEHRKGAAGKTPTFLKRVQETCNDGHFIHIPDTGTYVAACYSRTPPHKPQAGST
jgi:hypothetical protein